MKPLALILFVIILTGCARTTCVTKSWVKEGTPPVVHDNILVIALTGEGKSYVEKAIEEDVVADIRSRGYHAVSYYNQYGAVNTGKKNEASLVKDLRNNGETSILTITLLDTTMKTRFIYSDASYETLDQMNTRFIGYFQAPYWPSYDKRYEPGYYNSTVNYFWQARLYTATSQGVVYSAIIAAVDPGSTDKLAMQYSKAVVRDMEDNAILLRPKVRRLAPPSRTSVAVNVER